MIDMLRKYEIGEGNGCEEIVKCLLSFILLLSFTGTLVQAEETTSMSVEKQFKYLSSKGKRRGQWKGTSSDIRKVLRNTRKIRLSLMIQT